MIKMKQKTIVFKVMTPNKGGYDYIEFPAPFEDILDPKFERAYAYKNSSASPGHGSVEIMTELKNQKELKEQLYALVEMGYTPVEGFGKAQEDSKKDIQKRVADVMGKNFMPR